MRADYREFNLSGLERVTSGAGSVERLPLELERRGLERAVVVTGRTLGASALLDRVIGPLGGRCVAVCKDARQHVPACSVARVAQLLQDHGADSIISFGGGSPIDTAKAAVYSLLPASRTPGAGRWPVHIAIPTTLSAGEFTAVAGITDEKTRIKRPVSDSRITPRTVIADPTVTLETPAWLWAASGVRALDHAIESIYSVRHYPVSDAAASSGLTMLLKHLKASLDTTDPSVLEHRVECQLAAWMCVFGVTNAGFGLSHALGHQIGPRWDVPHGMTSCITLPHAMRFMADLAPERFGPIAEGFGVAFDPARPKVAALACADRAAAFIGQFDVPQRLRDVGIPAEELPEVAGVVHGVMDAAHVVDRPVTPDDLAQLLANAY
ncbi:MAG TPA: iron-containing alcohol dehydrogenase [Vicinamibacterales bacterium]|nr:iron-containing alcohol dehydrogenase [Vicinamibacterales bacterium]